MDSSLWGSGLGEAGGAVESVDSIYDSFGRRLVRVIPVACCTIDSQAEGAKLVADVAL